VAAPTKPSPATPAAGGSLFFTADADTPRSVTRHLFEPVPAPRPAPDAPEADTDGSPASADKPNGERSA
jgi:ribonuclease E